MISDSHIKYTDIRRNGQPLSIRQSEEFVVIQHRVEVLHPLRVHVSIKDDPLTLAYLTMHIVFDPTNMWFNIGEKGQKALTLNNIFEIFHVHSLNFQVQ